MRINALPDHVGQDRTVITLQADRRERPKLDGRVIDREQQMARRRDEHLAELAVPRDLLYVRLLATGPTGAKHVAIGGVDDRFTQAAEELAELGQPLVLDPRIEERIQAPVLGPELHRLAEAPGGSRDRG